MDLLYSPISAPTVRATGHLKPSAIGKLFVAILLVVVFEGAIRKWISPGFTNLLVLSRDCLALYGIYWAANNGKLKFSQAGAQILWLWTFLVLIWGLLQLMINQGSPLIFIIGVRFWLLYLWFAYAAAVAMTENDFRYITKSILLLLVMMVPLVVVQFYLPPSAFLNKQVEGEEGKVFLVTADIVRTTGTFSFTLGYTTFLALVTPFVLAMLMQRTQFRNKRWLPYVILLALGVGTMVSGSRGALIMFGLLFLGYLFVSLRYAKAADKSKSILMLVSALILLTLVPLVLSRAVDASKERFEAAAASEDFSARVLSMFFGEPGMYEDLSLIGHGIGVGTNFAGVVATGERAFLLAETEAARTILEGGIIGFVFIGLKILIILIGLRQSMRIAKLTANPLPMMLWLTLAIALLSWSIIGQLTVNALGYLLLGLGIASLRLSSLRR